MKELDEGNYWVVSLTTIKDGQNVGVRWQDENDKIKCFSSREEARSAWQNLNEDDKKYGSKVLFLEKYISSSDLQKNYVLIK